MVRAALTVIERKTSALVFVAGLLLTVLSILVFTFGEGLFSRLLVPRLIAARSTSGWHPARLSGRRRRPEAGWSGCSRYWR